MPRRPSLRQRVGKRDPQGCCKAVNALVVDRSKLRRSTLRRFVTRQVGHWLDAGPLSDLCPEGQLGPLFDLMQLNLAFNRAMAEAGWDDPSGTTVGVLEDGRLVVIGPEPTDERPNGVVLVELWKAESAANNGHHLGEPPRRRR